MRGIICTSLLGLGLSLAARPAAANVSTAIDVPVHAPTLRYSSPPSQLTQIVALPPHWYAPPRYVAVPLPVYPYHPLVPAHRHHKHSKHR